jgi:hypothetical protein
MFSTHCVICNVSVQPNEAEWRKHNNGKTHKKKSVNVSQSVVNVIHPSSSSDSNSSISSSCTVSMHACDTQSQNAVQCCISSPTLNEKASSTDRYVNSSKTPNENNQVNEAVSIQSESFLKLIQYFASSFTAYFKPSSTPCDDDDNQCLFSDDTLFKLPPGLTTQQQRLIVDSLPRLYFDESSSPSNSVSSFSSSSSSSSTSTSSSSSSSSSSFSSSSSSPSSSSTAAVKSNFVRFCKYCNVTLYSQARWNKHCESIQHDELSIRYNIERKERKAKEFAVIFNARCDAFNKGLPMPDESQYVKSDDDDDYDSDDDLSDFVVNFASQWNSFADDDYDYHDDAAC